MIRKPQLRTVLPGLAVALTVGAIAVAGPLTPPGSPSNPTMKSLNEIPASWHQILPANQSGDLDGLSGVCDSQRFRCAMPQSASGAAVLDLETGLVWQRTAGTSVARWRNAHRACVADDTGGRFGWRLPTVAELSTLKTPGGTAPFLSTGHPFDLTDPNTVSFWSHSETETNSDRAYTVDFSTDAAPVESDKLEFHRSWCVRGAL